MNLPVVKTAVIANGGTTSSAVDLEGYERGILIIPTITTGSLTFTTSPNDGTYVALDSTPSAPAAVTIVAATGGFAIDIPAAVMACKWIKIVAATQGAERTFTLVLK